MKLTVIGIGSPFGADTLGWDAANHLQSVLGAERGYTLDLHLSANPAVDLPALLQTSMHTLLLDALAPDSPIMTVRAITLDELADWQDTSSHGLGIGTTLRLLDGLGTLPPHWALVGMPTGLDAWRGALERVATAIVRDWESADLPA